MTSSDCTIRMVDTISGSVGSDKHSLFTLTRLQKGINWRAFLANAIPVTPLLVGLAYSISPTTVHINVGLKHLYAISWLFGYPTSIVLYTFFSYVSPPTASMVSETTGLPETIEAFETDSVDVENVGGGSSAASMVKRGEKGMTVDENRLS